MKRKWSFTFVSLAAALGLAATAAAWDEPELQQKMTQAQNLERKVQKGLAGDQKPAAAEQAVKLAALFDEIHDFWERKGLESAQERANDVAVRARAVSGLVERGDFDGAKLAAKNLNASCEGCHAAYSVKPAQ